MDLVGVGVDGLSPHDFPDEGRLQKMADDCRLLEVRQMPARLDALAAERAATKAQDGDRRGARPEEETRAQKKRLAPGRAWRWRVN